GSGGASAALHAIQSSARATTRQAQKRSFARVMAVAKRASFFGRTRTLPRSSELVAEPSEQRLPLDDLSCVLDPAGRVPVHHTQDAAALIRVDDHDLDWVGGGAEDGADRGEHLQGVEHADRKGLTHEHQERVTGAQPESRSAREVAELRIV